MPPKAGESSGTGAGKGNARKTTQASTAKVETGNDSGDAESEGEGDSIDENVAEDEEESVRSSDSSGESYNSDLGLHDFVIPDEEVERELLEEEEDEVEDTSGERPTTGIERAPDGTEVSGFSIFRVIQFTDKTGEDTICPINMGAEYFDVDYGHFLLELDGPETVDEVPVRNYGGQERYMPRRMLQVVSNPWGLPTNMEFVEDNGVGLPLAFVGEVVPAAFGGGVDFDEAEAVMVKEFGDPSIVIDFERRAGELAKKAAPIRRLVVDEEEAGFDVEEEEAELLNTPFEFPWHLVVDQNWLQKWIKERAPKSSSEKRDKGKDNGNGKGQKRPRSWRDTGEVPDSNDEEENTKPKPRKRATLTTLSTAAGQSRSSGTGGNSKRNPGPGAMMYARAISRLVSETQKRIKRRLPRTQR